MIELDVHIGGGGVLNQVGCDDAIDRKAVWIAQRCVTDAEAGSVLTVLSFCAEMVALSSAATEAVPPVVIVALVT